MRERLDEISGKLSRLRSIKNGGLTLLRDELLTRTEQIVRDLGRDGVFLVPVGELECWISHLMHGVTKRDKPTWATIAAQKLRDTEPEPADDIWAFVARVDAFLAMQLRE